MLSAKKAKYFNREEIYETNDGKSTVHDEPLFYHSIHARYDGKNFGMLFLIQSLNIANEFLSWLSSRTGTD